MAESFLCFTLRRIRWLFPVIYRGRSAAPHTEDEGNTAHISEIKPERERAGRLSADSADEHSVSWEEVKRKRKRKREREGDPGEKND